MGRIKSSQPSKSLDKLMARARQLVNSHGDRRKLPFFRHVLLTYHPNGIPHRAYDINTEYAYFPDYKGAWLVVTAATHTDMKQYLDKYPAILHYAIPACDRVNYRKRTEAERLGTDDPWEWVKHYSSTTPVEVDMAEKRKEQRRIVYDMLNQGLEVLHISLELDISKIHVRQYKYQRYSHGI